MEMTNQQGAIQFLETRLSQNVIHYCARVRSLSFRTQVLRGHCIFLSIFSILSVLCLVLSLKFLSVFTALILLLHLMYFLPHIVIEESITVMHGLGLQCRKKYLLGNISQTFIEKDKIEGVFIHEYICGARIQNSLAIVVSNESKLCLIFKHIYPGFEALKNVYCSCQKEL